MNKPTVRLLIEGQDVDFAAYPSLTLVETNPLISGDQGGYTYPFTLPLSPRNNRLFDYPTRTARAGKLPQGWSGELWIGLRRYAVKVSLTSIDRGEIGVSASVESGILAEKFKDRKLAHYLEGEHTFANVHACIGYLSNIPFTDSAVGMVDNVLLNYTPLEGESEVVGKKTFQINHRDGPNNTGVYQSKATDYIDEKTQSTNPTGYGIVPFLRLDWVLKKLFGEGFDPREVIPEGESDLLIANNVVDAIVRGKITYSQLAPDMSALDFIAAVEAYFGGKFVLQGGWFRFLKYNRWLESPNTLTLDSYLVDPPVVSLREGKQLVLTMENKFSEASFEFNSLNPLFEKVVGTMGGKTSYDTIQDFVKAWPDIYYNESKPDQPSAEEGYVRAYYSSQWNAMYTWRVGNSSADVQNLYTIISANTIGYDPGFLPEKQEIKIPVTPPCRLPMHDGLSFFAGVNWLNTVITDIDRKKDSSSDCLTFITNRYRSEGFKSGAFAPMTWGQKGIYMTHYAGYDMFLRHANQQITAKISREITPDVLGTYLLGGQRVVIEQITDNINLPYYEVTFRTTRLLEPYDVVEETKQIDGIISTEQDDISYSYRCEKGTRITKKRYRYKYTWAGGTFTYSDYIEEENWMSEPNHPDCPYTPPVHRVTISVNGQGSPEFSLGDGRWHDTPQEVTLIDGTLHLILRTTRAVYISPPPNPTYEDMCTIHFSGADTGSLYQIPMSGGDVGGYSLDPYPVSIHVPQWSSSVSIEFTYP